MTTRCLALAIPLLTLVHTARADDSPRITGNEVIVIEGAPPAPKVKAKPKKRYFPSGELDNIFLRPAPEYSDAAIEKDAWTLAWMLLDVNEAGKVTRVKFLKYPGYDLETIAIKTAMKMSFEPAIANDGRPVRSYVVTPIEWPSYGWLITRTQLATGIPDTTHVRCRGTGPKHMGSIYPAYRDCTRPDWANANSEPWLTDGKSVKRQ